MGYDAWVFLDVCTINKTDRETARNLIESIAGLDNPTNLDHDYEKNDRPKQYCANYEYMGEEAVRNATAEWLKDELQEIEKLDSVELEGSVQYIEQAPIEKFEFKNGKWK